MSPSAFVQIPLELVLLAVLVVVVPARAARVTAAVLGVVLGLLTVVKVLDLGFFAALNRPFDSVVDWRYLGSAVGLVDDSLGRPAAIGAVLLAALAVVGLLVLMPLALLRLVRVATRSRRRTLRAAVALGAAWVLCAVLGVHVAPDVPVASTRTSTYAFGQVTRIPSELRDQRAFARAARADPLRRTPTGRLLTGPARQGRAVRVRRELRPGGGPGLDDGPRRRPGPRRRHPTARRGRLRLPQRLPDLADLRGDQLAGALDAAVGPVGRQPAALRRADDQPPAHAEPGVRAGRLAHRQRRAGEHARLAAGGVLPLRPALRLPQRRLPRAPVRLPDDARPVHARRLPPARARAAAPQAGDGRDRPDHQPRTLVPYAAPGSARQPSGTGRCSTGCPSGHPPRR